MWRPQPTSTNAQSPDCLSVVPSAHVSCALSPRQSTPSHQVVSLGCPPPTSANAHSPWWYVCGALSLLQPTPTVTSRSSMTPSAQQSPIRIRRQTIRPPFPTSHGSRYASTLTSVDASQGGGWCATFPARKPLQNTSMSQGLTHVLNLSEGPTHSLLILCRWGGGGLPELAPALDNWVRLPA